MDDNEMRVRMHCFPCDEDIDVVVEARTPSNAVHKAWELHDKECVANLSEDE